MLEIKNINENEFKLLTNIPFSNGSESDTYIFKQDGQKKIFKLFKQENSIDNKVKKMILLKDRLKKCDFVVTADYIVKKDNKVIGYVMPKVEGKALHESCHTKEETINILKDVSKMLKQLHNLGIVCADFYRNFLIDSEGNINFIDHDNFSIDGLPVDLRNIHLVKYQEHINILDKRFDNYLLNMCMISLANNYITSCLYDRYRDKRNIFYFKDEEINNIVKNTMELKNFYNEDLIIDKINSKKDLKKIKRRIF